MDGGTEACIEPAKESNDNPAKTIPQTSVHIPVRASKHSVPNRGSTRVNETADHMKAKDASTVDETDLMSRITRSLSMSIDHKQYQENVDKRMSLKNFSLKDIEAEIASAAVDVELAPSVDSDNSTVHMHQSLGGASLYDNSMSLERSERSERGSRLSPIDGIGFQPFASNTSSGRSSIRRSISPSPEMEESQRQSSSYTPVEYDTSNAYIYGGSSNKSGISSEMSPNSRYAGSNIGFSNNDYDDDADLSPSDHEEMEVAAETEQSAEEMYNRLKQGSAQTAVESTYSSGYNSASVRVLKPSSSSLQLGLRKSSLSHGASHSNSSSSSFSKNEKSLVGKSANERLYNAAQMDRDKQARRAKIAADSEIKALEDGKFKLNKISKKIVSNLRPKNYNHTHIGDRLYEEGLAEKQLKEKRAEELKDKLTPEEWSCAKCGTFQKIYKTSIVIQPLHQMQSKARILNNNGQHSPDGKLPNHEQHVCKACGWDQGAVPAHQPVNIALTLSDEPEDLLKSRWQGGGSGAGPEGGGVHQYLYENARTRENIQQLNRALWNEAHSGLTFAPVIPESSVEMLQKYKVSATTPGASGKSGADGSVYTFSESDLPPPPPLSLGQSRDGKNILAGPALGAYMSKSATERLSTTQTRPVADIAAHHRRQMEGSSLASTTNYVDQEQFVNRLVYEYKDKQQRLQKAADFHSKHDIYTGERLFQPKVGPDPEEALGLGVTRDKATNAKKRDVFEDIMLKDKQLKMRRKEAEEKAVEHLMKDISSKQVRALETSQAILKQSTENNIEELFQVLLEAQQQIIQDGNAPPLASETSNGSSSSSSPVAVPEWKHYLLDLDQINTDMMIPEVGLLLNEIRAYKLSQQHARAGRTSQNKPAPPIAPSKQEDAPNSGETEPGGHGEVPAAVEPAMANMLVSFATFRLLMLKCMKRRDGTGRSYVYVPKKKPDVAIQMIQNKLKEETFRPTIDKNSAALCMRRHKDLSDYHIEDALREEGERIRSKWESARQERILQDSKELTFKPKLFKPPSYIKPKYWGMEESVAIDIDSDSDSETGKRAEPYRHHDDSHFHLHEIEESVALEARHLDESSMVSSDDEAQVVQMPPLQSRPPTLPARTHAVLNVPPSVGPSGVESTRKVADHRQHYQQQEQKQQQQSGRSARREISPVHRPRDLSPSTQQSDDDDQQSINTISTKFTTDDQPPLQQQNHSSAYQSGGRSVGSGAPLVTRRNQSSSGVKNSQTPSSTVHLHVGAAAGGATKANKLKLVSSVVKSGKLAAPGRSMVAPPPLPHELMKQK